MKQKQKTQDVHDKGIRRFISNAFFILARFFAAVQSCAQMYKIYNLIRPRYTRYKQLYNFIQKKHINFTYPRCKWYIQVQKALWQVDMFFLIPCSLLFCFHSFKNALNFFTILQFLLYHREFCVYFLDKEYKNNKLNIFLLAYKSVCVLKVV